MVSAAGIAVWVPVLQHGCGHMVRRLHLCRVDASHTVPARRKRHGPAQNHLPRPWNTNRRGMARKSAGLSSLSFFFYFRGVSGGSICEIISKNTEGDLFFLSLFFRSGFITLVNFSLIQNCHRAIPNCRTMFLSDSSPGRRCETFSRQRVPTP